MPGAQIFGDRFGKLSRFFQEDGQQLLVEFVLDLLRVEHESAGSRGCRRARRFCSGRRQFRYCTGFNCRKFFRRYFKRCRCRRRVELLQRVDQMRHGFRFALVGDIGNHGFKRSNGLADNFDGADTACLIGCFTTQQCVFERCPEVVECGQAYRAGDTGQRMRGTGHRVRCRQRWFAGDRLKLALQGCQVRTGFFEKDLVERRRNGQLRLAFDLGDNRCKHLFRGGFRDFHSFHGINGIERLQRFRRRFRLGQYLLLWRRTGCFDRRRIDD